VVDLRKLVTSEKSVKQAIQAFLGSLDSGTRCMENDLASGVKFEMSEELSRLVISIASLNFKQMRSGNQEDLAAKIYDSLVVYARRVQPGISKIHNFGGSDESSH
jgi:hypothetical protein